MVYRRQLHLLDHHQFTRMGTMGALMDMGTMGALMDLAFGIDHPCIVLYYMVDGVRHEMQNIIPEEEIMGGMPIRET
jgi:hypothetical protein